MRKSFLGYSLLLLIIACGSSPSNRQTNTQAVPVWVYNLEQAFPDRDWVRVTQQGSSQQQSESAAMNALAAVFRTNLDGLIQTTQQFNQIVSDAAGMRNINFNQNRDLQGMVTTFTRVRDLIGVQLDVYTAPDRTVYAVARMNRRESATRYSGMIRENTAIIDSLLASAASFPVQGSFDVYARLSFAHAIAQVTDNFQNLLEVIDPTAAGRRPSYGGANNIRARMFECASLITIGVIVDTERAVDRTLFSRAAGTYFRDLGFRINEQSSPGQQVTGNYILHVNVRFEELYQNLFSSRYYLDAAMEDRRGAAIFSFTENDRRSHPNTASEARRLAVLAVETSFKEGKFAEEFSTWLNSLIE